MGKSDTVRSNGSSGDAATVEEEKSPTMRFSHIRTANRRKTTGGNNDENKSKNEDVEEVIKEKSEEVIEKTALLIDYSSLQMDTRQQCKCGYVLSDAEVMASWPEEFISTSINCKVCNLNSFVPKIRVKCNATEMSLEQQIYQQTSLDFKVTYLSPPYLRRSMETIVGKYRHHLEDSESLRKNHSDEYWNLLWYFVQRRLDLNWLLEELDSNKLQISPIVDLELTKFPTKDE
ncbi:hypothetical protein RFI_39579, partial [Reticulomyxa filosa]